MIIPKGRLRADGFTLLEVAIASAVLAIALFTLIGVCANGLKIARTLDRVHVDATSLAAEFSLSNRLDDLDQSGDFGNIHPGYQWMCHCEEVGTNGFFRADFTVLAVGDPKGTERHLSIFLYRPDSIRRLR